VAFNPQQIIVDLIKLVAGRPVCIAYSGGVDSHVLLHLLANTQHPQLTSIRTIYVDHGLHAESDKWREHCASVSKSLDITFESLTVSVENIDELGLEAAARQARYHAFSSALFENEVLVTAQHQQDQAETLMLQLLRGSGPSGLSAMGRESTMKGMTILRPLLGLSKADMLDYAQLHQLSWIEDPSNADLTLNRNYLRHQVFPNLESRWPAVAKTMSRSADHCREATVLLQELAHLDAQRVCIDPPNILSVSALTELSEPRQRNLLRFSIEQCDLNLPSTVILQRVIDEVCSAAEDKSPHVHWPGAEIRRYRDQLIIQAVKTTNTELTEQHIEGASELELTDGRWLKWQVVSGQGLKSHVAKGPLQLKFRQGGEKIRLQGHSQHKALKQLFQEWGVPPWQRQFIPLLFVEQELVAVVGYGYAEHYAADIGEKGWLPYLEPVE